VDFIITPLIFLLIGLVFGTFAGRGAWWILAIPVAFFLLDLKSEGFDVHSFLLALVTIGATVLGVLLGKSIARSRFEHEPA
jgi:hypothetical protein